MRRNTPRHAETNRRLLIGNCWAMKGQTGQCAVEPQCPLLQRLRALALTVIPRMPTLADGRKNKHQVPWNLHVFRCVVRCVSAVVYCVAHTRTLPYTMWNSVRDVCMELVSDEQQRGQKFWDGTTSFEMFRSVLMWNKLTMRTCMGIVSVTLMLIAIEWAALSWFDMFRKVMQSDGIC